MKADQSAWFSPGNTVSISVTADGTSPFTYQWKKNGVNISGATSATYVISNAQAADAATYTVVVSNAAGNTTSDNAIVAMLVAPSVTSQPSSQTVNAGGNASFAITAAGGPAPSIQWRKNGVNLSNGGQISGATTNILTITGVTAADAGTYSAVLTNTLGSVASNNATLTVGTAPSFTTQPSNQGAISGGNVTFTVAVSGTPTPTVQWKKNGVNLTDGGNVSGATTTSLTLTNVSSSDAGNYTVVATNSAGSVVSNGANLSIGNAPVITGQPANQTAVPGATVSFTISATGTPAPTIQWRKNGVNLSNGGIFSGTNTTTLTLTGIATGDAGTYTAVASNTAGTAVSAGATLSVGNSPAITTQPLSQNALVDSSVVFSVVASGNPAPTIQWEKNGLNLTDGGSISGATTSSLTISPVALADAGIYRAVATNSLGSAPSDSVTLSVGNIPAIKKNPLGQTAAAGANVTFTATVTGIPTPVLQWKKDGVDLVNGSNVGGADTDTLTIVGVTAADAGTYSLIATNSEGSAASKGALLTVNVPPQITSQPTALAAPANSTVTFAVSATGTAPLTYQWSKDGVAITDSTRISGTTTATLKITGVNSGDAATYRVVVTNVAGSATSDGGAVLTLAPSGVPVFGTQPTSHTATVGNTTTFTVSATGNPTPTFQWTKDGVLLTNGGNISGATTNTLTITGATLADAGTYASIASNSVGTVTSNSATLDVGIPPTINSAPQSRSIAAGANVNFSVTFSGQPAPTVRWTKDGYPVSDGGNISGALTATLSITGASSNNAGIYSAVVSNGFGSVTSAGAELKVSSRTSITSQPANQLVPAGGSAFFTVAAVGYPTPTIQWQHNGTNLVNDGHFAGVDTTTLWISNVTNADAGAYQAVATNPLGSKTSNAATLTVSAAAALLSQPPSLTVVSTGTQVVYAVTVGGEQPVTMQWRKNGTNISDSGNISGSNTATLVLSNVTTANNGKYSIRVSNSAGSAVSNDAELAVLESTSSNQAVTEGHSVTLAVTSATGSLQWQTQSTSGEWTNLTESSTYKGTTSASLEISTATSAMNGAQFRLVSTAGGTNSVIRNFVLSVASAGVLSNPVGITLDALGTLYVTDTAIDVVQKIDGVGTVSLFAGASGSTGTADGSSTSARFNDPTGIAALANGSFAITDNANATIRLATSSGTVSTLAGSTSTRGNTDGTGSAATFSSPMGIATDPNGNLLVVDSTNHTIRKVTPTGIVTTFAGTAGNAGYADGAGGRFNRPTGVAIASNGIIYVSDTTNNLIRKITPEGLISTFAGTIGVSGTSDGLGSAALFNRPTGITVDQSGTVYVADTGNSTIRKITPDGLTSTLAGLPGIAGLKDGTGSDAWFNQPLGVSASPAGFVYVADTGNAAIRRVATDGSVTTLNLASASSASTLPTPSTPTVPSVPSTPTTPTTPTLPTSPTPVTSSSGGGGGGGAPSIWLLSSLLTTWVLRRLIKK